MSIKVNSEKELNKVVELLNNNHDVIKEAYIILTGEELNSEILEDINICNVEKTVNNDIITYYLGIGFYTHKNYISIDDACINYNKKDKTIELNTNFTAFMDIRIED
jgi:hypothetical protein